jgi:peptide subunit release factor 1 (eRF1)
VEESESDCLHCEINEVVQEHMERLETVELPELVSKVGESLVDLILLGPKEQWGNLLAEAISDVGHLFLEKSGAIGGGTSH